MEIFISAWYMVWFAVHHTHHTQLCQVCHSNSMPGLSYWAKTLPDKVPVLWQISNDKIKITCYINHIKNFPVLLYIMGELEHMEQKVIKSAFLLSCKFLPKSAEHHIYLKYDCLSFRLRRLAEYCVHDI